MFTRSANSAPTHSISFLQKDTHFKGPLRLYATYRSISTPLLTRTALSYPERDSCHRGWNHLLRSYPLLKPTVYRTCSDWATYRFWLVGLPK
jgi:hypothetical protein